MDGSGWKPTIVEEIIKQIDLSFGVAKDDRASWFHLKEEVVDRIALLVLVHKHNVLTDVTMRLSSTAYTNADVILGHVLACHLARSLRECSREHQVDVIGVFVCVCGWSDQSSTLSAPRYQGLLTTASHDLV
jgi:uncharacterized membrane protein